MSTKLRDYDDKSYAIALQEDNKIIVAGKSFNGKYFDFALARYKLDNSKILEK